MAKKPVKTAVDRLAERIAERIDADKHRPKGLKRTQVGLAAHIGVTKSTLNEMLNGKKAGQGALARLDKIAEYFGVPPSLLVHRNDTALMEVQTGEFRLLMHWRRFPPSVQQRVMEMFDYFAGLLPEEQEARRWWHRVQLLKARNPERARAIDRAIDEALTAPRTEPGEGNPSADQPTSDATAPATQPRRR